MKQFPIIIKTEHGNYPITLITLVFKTLNQV